MDDGVVLYEGERQGLLLQAGGGGGGTDWGGLEAVPTFAGEGYPGYVVVAGYERQSVARDSAVAPGSPGDGGRGEGEVVGLAPATGGLTTGDLAKSDSPSLAQEVISPGAPVVSPLSPLLTDLQVKSSEGAGRPEGVNPRVRVRLPPQFVFSGRNRHGGNMIPPAWSRHN